MKNTKKSLPVVISSIILVVMLVIPFIYFDNGESVSINAPTGSYAETFADDNKLDFIALSDSENSDVEIPTTVEETTVPVSEETTVEEETTEFSNVTEKENDTFSYNYNGNTVTITGYKGSDSVVEVPCEIDGLPVTAISMNAVKYGIKVLQIPSSVVCIEGTYKTARYNSDFFLSIAIIVLGYIFSIVATFVAFRKNDDNQGTFLGISSAYGGLLTLIILGIWANISIFIDISRIVRVIVSIIIFAIAIAKLFMRKVAKEEILETEANVKTKTAFIKMMTVEAQNIVAAAKTNEAKASANKVYEALRYSDPMSNDSLSVEEVKITVKMDEFAKAVSAETENIEEISEELLLLLNRRNKICEQMK